MVSSDLENNFYSTSPRFAKQKVLAKISYHEIAILTEEYELIIKHDVYMAQNKNQ